MKSFLAERGLMITLTDLYEDLQNDLNYNLEAYLRSIILEPGLRIAEGDEFSITRQGDSLVAPAGAIVFPNYELFVPEREASHLRADISELELAVGEVAKDINVYVALETTETHPQRQAQSKDLFYTVRRNAIKLVVCDSTTMPPAQSYLLARGSIDDQQNISLTDVRHNSVLKIVSIYEAHDWDPYQSIMPAVSDVKVGGLRLADYRQEIYNNQPINQRSIPLNEHGGHCLDVHWPAPSGDEMEAMGGIAYYKVTATPIEGESEYREATVEQTVVVSREDIETEQPLRIGCLVPVTTGVKYNVRVYRVSNLLNLRVANASDAVVGSIGLNPEYTSIENLTISITEGYNSYEFLTISVNDQPGPARALRLYVAEYSGSPPDELTDRRYLYYEGPITSIDYQINDFANTGIAVHAQVVGKNQEILAEAENEYEFPESFVDWEDLIYFTVPENISGWPDKPSSNCNDVALNFTVIEDGGTKYVQVAIPPAHKPAARWIGEWVYIGASSDVAELALGWHEIVNVERNGMGNTDYIYFQSGANVGVAETCKIYGNAKFIAGDGTDMPIVVDYPAGAHFAGQFSTGQKVKVSNSMDATLLADGDYVVRDATSTQDWAYNDLADDHAFMIDEMSDGTARDTYGDITTPLEITLGQFQLKNDAIVSRVQTCSQSHAHISDGEGNAVVITITGNGPGGIVDYSFDVPDSGYANASFSDELIFGAGETITIKAMIIADRYFNLSGLRIGIYLRYKL